MGIETVIWRKDREEELKVRRIRTIESVPPDLGIKKMLTFDIYRPTGMFDIESGKHEYRYLRTEVEPNTTYYDIVVSQTRMDDIINGVIKQSILPGIPDILDEAKIGDFLRISDGSKETTKQITTVFPMILKQETVLIPSNGDSVEYSWEAPEVVNLGLMSGFQNGLQLKEAISNISEDGCVVVVRW